MQQSHAGRSLIAACSLMLQLSLDGVGLTCPSSLGCQDDSTQGERGGLTWCPNVIPQKIDPTCHGGRSTQRSDLGFQGLSSSGGLDLGWSTLTLTEVSWRESQRSIIVPSQDKKYRMSCWSCVNIRIGALLVQGGGATRRARRGRCEE